MDTGIREAIGILFPFAAHQLDQRLQLKEQRTAPHFSSGDSASKADDGSGFFDDEEEPEVEFGSTDPTCPLMEGSATQRYIRQLSYCDYSWIWVHIAVLVLGPVIFWRGFLCCAGRCLRPLQTPRRDVAFVAPRARRPSTGAGARQR